MCMYTYVEAQQTSDNPQRKNSAFLRTLFCRYTESSRLGRMTHGKLQGPPPSIRLACSSVSHATHACGPNAKRHEKHAEKKKKKK